MGLFDRLAGKFKSSEPAKRPEEPSASGTDTPFGEDITLGQTSCLVGDLVYGEDDSEYLTTFLVNDAFKEAKSHAGEVEPLFTYAPYGEYGEEGTCPYLAVQCDDAVYCAIEEFKEAGTFEGALELTPLTGTFYFKAKIEYYGNLMYFYGMDRCGGALENQGLCMVYPKALAGTEAERTLMRVLDEAAESYREERKA